MARWTIKDAEEELVYCEKLCREGGDASVPRDLVYGYVTMQGRSIARDGMGREDFRDLADRFQDMATAFVTREVELSKAADEVTE